MIILPTVQHMVIYVTCLHTALWTNLANQLGDYPSQKLMSECGLSANAIAAHIDGSTVHHWSGISVGDVDGAVITKDAHKLSTRCQSLRFVLVGQAPLFVAAEVIGGRRPPSDNLAVGRVRMTLSAPAAPWHPGTTVPTLPLLVGPPPILPEKFDFW